MMTPGRKAHAAWLLRCKAEKALALHTNCHSAAYMDAFRAFEKADRRWKRLTEESAELEGDW